MRCILRQEAGCSLERHASLDVSTTNSDKSCRTKLENKQPFALTDRLESTRARLRRPACTLHMQPAPEWRAGSERIVEGLIRDKFRRNAKAREVLIGTGRVKLVYTNSHEDRVWGVCGGESSRVFLVLADARLMWAHGVRLKDLPVGLL